MLWIFIEFFEAYEFVYNVFEGDEGRKFQDILVEFNNALSHLIAFAYNHNETNIKKAISHLYRGILDCYKEIIHKNYDIVKKNDQIIKQLDDKTYLQYYIDLRKEEASNIGADEAIKKDNILKGYKQLSWLLVGWLPYHYSFYKLLTFWFCGVFQHFTTENLGVSRYLKNTIKNLTILPIFAIKFA